MTTVHAGTLCSSVPNALAHRSRPAFGSGVLQISLGGQKHCDALCSRCGAPMRRLAAEMSVARSRLHCWRRQRWPCLPLARPLTNDPLRGAVPGSQGATPPGAAAHAASRAMPSPATARRHPRSPPSHQPSRSRAHQLASPVRASRRPSVVAKRRRSSRDHRATAPTAHVPSPADPSRCRRCWSAAAPIWLRLRCPVNGADAGAQIDKRSPRDWTIHASQNLANGTHTVSVLVRDASGAAGGFTWQFTVGGGNRRPRPAPATRHAP